MCGIAGYFGFNGKDLLNKFSKDLKHRGPDGEGIFFDNNIGFLNRRLSIVDEKRGNQPFFNENQTIVVIYNGEIYNYKELRSELKRNDHIFNTESDTEIIAHTYEQEGVNGFSRYNGMFTIALFDKKTETLILARDRFGIKPLYYSIIDNKFIFASEIKALLNTRLIRTEVNEKILYRYLRYRVHDDLEDTFFLGIKRLLPGEVLEISKSSNKLILKRSKLKIEKNNKDINNYYSQDTKILFKNFKDELINSIKIRLPKEETIGTCLSGGIDSSVITSIVSKLIKENNRVNKNNNKKNLSIFSAIFPKYSNNEEDYINEVIRNLDSSYKYYTVKPNSSKFICEVTDFVRTQEEPTISTGPYAQYCLMKTAKDKIRIIYDGQGADEMLAGYIPYLFVYFRELIHKSQYIVLIKELICSFDLIMPIIKDKLKEKIGIKMKISITKLLNKKFIEENKKLLFINTTDNLKQRLKEDIFKNSLQALLRYEDRNTMRFSIEGRVPFLDNNLYAYLVSLPSTMIIRNGWNKYILRESFKVLIPEKVRTRRNKIGLTTPEQEWFREQKEWVLCVFNSNSFKNRKYFNQKQTLLAFKDFLERKNNDSLIFWRLINTELWLREFIDRKN